MKLKKPKKEEVKILVVDDETIVALDIRNTLQKYGYKVVGIAGNSSEALKIVKSEKPNLILMDIMLKGQKDGIETSEEINKIADIPIIFLTAYSDDNTLERAKLVEPYGYLIKPFDNRELFTTIEMSLYKHSMEVNIRESEENLAITLNSIGDGVISTDEKGIVVRMNPVAQKLTGWKLDEARGKHLEEIFNIIDATTREPLVNPVDKVIKSGKVIGLSNHTILISKSGKEINISDSAAPIRDYDGEVRGVVLVFSDVTESYKAREEMQKSEEKFRALVTQMQQGLAVHEVITDKKGKVVDYRFLEVNDSYEKLTGLKRKRIIGKTVKEVLPDIEEYWIEKFGEVAITGVPITYENYVKELNNYYEVVVYRNQPNQFAVIVNNITERKNTENKLKQNQEILTDIVESVKEGLTYASLKGKIISVNKALLDILELEKDEVIGADLKVIAKKILPVKSFVTVLPKIINILNGNDIEPFDLEYKNKVLEISAVYNSNSERIIGVFRDITERKRAQERIGLMASLLDLSPASVIVHDLNGNIIYANKKTLEMHGYTEEQFLKFNLKDIDTPESAELIESRIKEINKKGELTFEVGHKKKDGTSFPLLVNTKKARWGDKDVLLSVSTDITERKLAEQKIRESEEKFRSYIENAPDAIMVVDRKGNYLMANNAAAEMTGYSIDELTRMNILDVTHPDDHVKGERHFKNVVGKGEAIDEVRYITKKGEVRYWSVKAIKLDDDRFLGFQSDITERKLAEEALRESEERFALAIDASEQGIWDWNLLTNQVYFSSQWKKQIGYEDFEIKNEFSEWTDHLHPDDRERCLSEVQSYLQNPVKHFIIEFRFRHKDGSYRWIHNKAASILNSDGKVIRMFGAHLDFTERKLAEAAIKLSESKFNIAFHASPVAMAIQDENDIFIDINLAFIKLTGYLKEEVIGRPGLELNLWADLNQRNYVNSEFERNRVVKNYEFQFRRKNGSTGFGILSSEMIDINGKSASLTTVIDITERKSAESALSESESKFRSLVTSLSDIVYTLDTEQRHTGVFGEWVTKSGLTPQYFIGRTARDIFGEEASSIHEKENLKVLNGESVVYEWSMVSQDSKLFYQTSLAPLRDSSGNILGIVGVARDISNLKLAEEKIRESEEKFRNLFNTMPNGYYRSTREGYFVDANPAFIQMLGYSNLEELKSVYIPTDIFVHSVEREEILTNNPGFISNVETYRLRRKDGKIIWVEDNARYIKDETGNVIFNEGICKDITDRKNIEDALRESEQLFNTLAQVSPVGIFRTDPDGLTTYVNPTWIRLSGISFEQAMGDGWINAVHPDDREKLSSGWKFSTIENDVSVAEYRFLRPDGNIVWVMGQAIPEFDSDNRIVGYVGTITDITDRKQSEDALRQSEEKFRAITEQTNSLISLTDANGIITYASPSALEIFNYLPEEMVGRHFMEFLYEEDIQKAVNAFREAVDKIRVTKNLILRMKRKDGSIFYGELNGSDFHSGESRGSLVVIQDISERIKSDEALRESEERFRIIAEKTGTIVYDRDLITNKVHREGAIQEVLGYTKDEYNSLSVEQFNQLLHQEDRLRVIEEEGKLFNKGGNITQFYRLRHKNGNYVQIEDNSVVLTDKYGRGSRLLGSMKDITERKHTEEALRESEELHRKLLLTVPDLIIRTNLKGDIIFVNESVLQSLGYVPKENLLGKNMLNFISPKDKERAIRNSKLMLERPLGIQEYTLVFEDGYELISEVNGDVIVDSESNPIGMVYVVRDISERKKAEENLRKLSHAVEQSQVSIVITNTDGVIEYVNPKFCEVTGYTVEEAIGQNPRILKSGEWKPETYKGLWSNISSGRNWTGIFHNRKKNGELFWESAHISPIKNEAGLVTHYIAVKEDITEKVKAEDELIRYREHLEEMVEERTAQVNSQNVFLRTLIDTIPNPIFVKDINGNYTDVNPAFEKLTGKSKDDLLGKNLDIVLDGRARELAIETDGKLLNGEPISIYEVEVKNAEGVMVPFIVYKAAFGFSGNKPEGIMGLLVDISERKQMEEKTIQALNRERELNEMKTNFISMASHEFRTPLTTILASADLVELYHLKWPVEKILNHIKKIQDSVNYMTTLLDDVLTLSRADRGKLKFTPDILNLRELCNEIIKEISYQAGPSHNLIFDCKLSKDNYILDRKLLTQILNNLLSNAVKFSPQGGTVSLNILENEGEIEFIVSDQGLGIDQNDLKNIFEPFFRGKNVSDINGSGLGLNIVKNAVDLHGGDIEIESELNKGTRIIFSVKAV